MRPKTFGTTKCWQPTNGLMGNQIENFERKRCFSSYWGANKNESNWRQPKKKTESHIMPAEYFLLLLRTLHLLFRYLMTHVNATHRTSYVSRRIQPLTWTNRHITSRCRFIDMLFFHFNCVVIVSIYSANENPKAKRNFLASKQDKRRPEIGDNSPFFRNQLNSVSVRATVCVVHVVFSGQTEASNGNSRNKWLFAISQLTHDDRTVLVFCSLIRGRSNTFSQSTYAT